MFLTLQLSLLSSLQFLLNDHMKNNFIQNDDHQLSWPVPSYYAYCILNLCYASHCSVNITFFSQHYIFVLLLDRPYWLDFSISKKKACRIFLGLFSLVYLSSCPMWLGWIYVCIFQVWQVHACIKILIVLCNINCSPRKNVSTLLGWQNLICRSQQLLISLMARVRTAG